MPAPAPWAMLRELTESRVALGRSGDAMRTADQLELRFAHARARDAVHRPLNVPALVEQLGTGRAGRAGEPIVVASAAPDRATYLSRPDLGRRLADGTAGRLPGTRADLAFVLADGLSPLAVQQHASPLLETVLPRLGEDWTVAPIVVATEARVALGDEIGAALGATIVVVLIGERPGLSAADSLGVYLTHGPRVGLAEAARNCISNVRTPRGQSYAAAADTLVALLTESRRRGLSGVALKDDGPLLQA